MDNHNCVCDQILTRPKLGYLWICGQGGLLFLALQVGRIVKSWAKCLSFTRPKWNILLPRSLFTFCFKCLILIFTCRHLIIFLIYMYSIFKVFYNVPMQKYEVFLKLGKSTTYNPKTLSTWIMTFYIILVLN